MSFSSSFLLTQFMKLTVSPLVYNANLHVANCWFDISRFDDDLFIKENIFLPATVKCSTGKRRAEYFAGRYLAKQCLTEMGIQQFNVFSDSNRCPIWPEHLLGSISHSNDSAVCIVAKKKDYVAVGVDTENWVVQANAAEELGNVVLDQRERWLVNTMSEGLDKYFTHIFSAKESIFKALYPAVGRYFNFSAAKLISMDLPQNSLCFELAENLADAYCEGVQLRVWFNESASGVTTLCLIEHKNISG